MSARGDSVSYLLFLQNRKQLRDWGIQFREGEPRDAHNLLVHTLHVVSGQSPKILKNLFDPRSLCGAIPWYAYYVQGCSGCGAQDCRYGAICVISDQRGVRILTLESSPDNSVPLSELNFSDSGYPQESLESDLIQIKRSHYLASFLCQESSPPLQCLAHFS